MIAITGANGQLGRLVIASLLQRVPASEVVATVRSLEKGQALAELGVSVRVADYNRPETLETAFAGVEKVLLISSNEMGARVAQHKAVIDGAKRAGVKLIAYTSILHGDRSPLGIAEEHIETETYLTTSGVPHVVLRNGWYTENYVGSVAAALQHKAVFGAAGEGRISAASRADYADATVAVLTAEADQAGRVYELAGDEGFTLAELADEIGRQTGEAIGYTHLSEAAYADVLAGAGLPVALAAAFAQADTGIAQGGLFEDSRQLSALTGRPTITLAEAVAAMLKGLAVHA